MKNIFLWYFFPYNHLSPAAARRCINTKLDCRDLRKNSKLHRSFFFSHKHPSTNAHIHRHLNHKNTFSYVFPSPRLIWVCVCACVRTSLHAHLRIMLHTSPTHVHYSDVNYKHIQTLPSPLRHTRNIFQVLSHNPNTSTVVHCECKCEDFCKNFTAFIIFYDRLFIYFLFCHKYTKKVEHQFDLDILHTYMHIKSCNTHIAKHFVLSRQLFFFVLWLPSHISLTPQKKERSEVY